MRNMFLNNKIKHWSYRHFIEPLNELKLLQSKFLIRELKTEEKLKNIQEAEFKVFSQFGDDGIIQYIINRANIIYPNDKFIEFGVADYTESNTRFLLVNNNWRGLVMDSSEHNIKYIKSDEIYWKYDLTALCAFIKKSNINGLIEKAGFRNNIGLMHIDLDGNDYWIWKSITVCNPILVILEYNSVFGNERALTIPYRSNFVRKDASFSRLYWGASLRAFCCLAKEKGYEFIGSNSTGINAYFIRKDYSSRFRVLGCKEGYVLSRYRESRDAKGNLTYMSGEDRLKLISHLSVFDVEKKSEISLKEISK